MRVLVGASVFGGGVKTPDVLRLLHFAYEQRHRVLVQPREAYARWSARMTADDAEVYTHGLDWSEEQETRDPARYELRVEAQAADGAVDVVRAIERLERPFVLVVENDRSDRRFLEAVAPDEAKGRLRFLLQRSWIQCHARDGLTGIPKLIEDGLRDTPGEVDRFFAIFDSDAEAPDAPRSENRRQGEACDALGVQHRMLARRMIENYLTRPAIEAWVKAQPRVDRHSARLDALYGGWCAERPERRHYFHMKDGLKSMTRGPQYAGIPGDVERALTDGFGRDVATAFGEYGVLEHDLRAEGSWDELSSLVRDVLRCAQ